MELTPDIEIIIEGLLFGVLTAGVTFYKLASFVQIKKAIYQS